MLKHLLMRLPALDRKSAKLIAEHNEMIDFQGGILLGKFGAGISRRSEAIVSKQISNGKNIQLFLAQRAGSSYLGYKAKISEIYSDYREYRGELKLPSYYQERPSSVFVLSGKLENADLSNLLLESNERPLLEVLSITRTPVMLVVDRDELLSTRAAPSVV